MKKLIHPQELMTFVGPGNTTIMVTEFIILGFRDLKGLAPLLLLVFGIVNLATISGNLLIMILVSTQQGLQTPMYFFLANLSCLEVCYTSNIACGLVEREQSDLHGRLYYSVTYPRSHS